MEKIIVKNNEEQVFLNFDTRFYPYNFIFLAVKDFSNCCWVSMGGNPSNIEVVLKPKSDDMNLDILGYEFYNYVLGLIKNSGDVKETLEICR